MINACFEIDTAWQFHLGLEKWSHITGIFSMQSFGIKPHGHLN